MDNETFHPSVRGSIENLLFHRDPEARGVAAETLGSGSMCLADEREALEALNCALHDPSLRVQEVALQSLVRLSHQ